MKYAWIDARRRDFGLDEMCAVLDVSESGYRSWMALTAKDSEHDYLKSLGAAEILLRKNFEMGGRPLEKSQWAGALDTVGGDTLAWLTRTMQQSGVIASIGNAGGIKLHSTVLPFILRCASYRD